MKKGWDKGWDIRVSRRSFRSIVRDLREDDEGNEGVCESEREGGRKRGSKEYTCPFYDWALSDTIGHRGVAVYNASQPQEQKLRALSSSIHTIPISYPSFSATRSSSPPFSSKKPLILTKTRISNHTPEIPILHIKPPAYIK